MRSDRFFRPKLLDGALQFKFLLLQPETLLARLLLLAGLAPEIILDPRGVDLSQLKDFALQIFYLSLLGTDFLVFGIQCDFLFSCCFVKKLLH